MSKKILIHLIAVIVIFAIGIFIGNKISKKNKTSTENQNNSFQAGWDAARERLSKLPVATVLPADAEMKSVSGTIQKIDKGELTVKINSIDSLSDPDLDIRTITVNSNTKLNLIVQKDPEKLKKEEQEFQDKMRQLAEQTNSVEHLMPPVSFEKKEIKLSDLKENQEIAIAANENIKDKKEFTAVEIDAQEVLTMPAEAVSASVNPAL